MSISAAIKEMTEKEWDAQLFNSKKGVATMTGWTSYHTLRSRGSQPGFPDRTLYRDRVIFAELKAERGKPTERQIEWLTGLAGAGAEVYLWQPGDLDEIGLILSGQWVWLPGQHKLVPKHMPPGEPTVGWQPCSLWLREGRRAGSA
jgi:hypothetical protein